MNPIYEYYEWLQENPRSNKVYATYKHIIEFLEDEDGEFYYDEKAANKTIKFIEGFCKHTKGKLANKPFKLMLWQKALLASTFGILNKETKLRKYERVFLAIPRKNGKTTLAGAVALYLLVADKEEGPEVYVVATKREQAKGTFDISREMVKKNASLLKKVQPNKHELISEFNAGVYKPLAKESNTLDGLNAHGAILDEIHAWQDQNLFDVVVDSTTSRTQPLIFMTTTAGTVRDSVYDNLYANAEQTIKGYAEGTYVDEKTLYMVYELNNRENWSNPDHWIEANPNMEFIPEIKESLEYKTEKAKHNRKDLKNILTKHFNIPETDSASWLSAETIKNPETFDINDFKGSYAIGGVDLSQTTDLTCATILMKNEDPNDDRFFIEQMYFLPGDSIKERAKTDKVPYDIWQQRGLLRGSGTNIIDYADVVDWFVEMRDKYNIYYFSIGYDRYNAGYFIADMEQKLGRGIMDDIPQGARTFSTPMKQLEKELEAKKIVFNQNPILTWCLMNSSVKIDANDNYMLKKGKNEKRRIDGTASLLDAYISYLNHKVGYDSYQKGI